MPTTGSLPTILIITGATEGHTEIRLLGEIGDEGATSDVADAHDHWRNSRGPAA